jgi:ribosome-binding protein aMBF1 (putative translation factor)
MASGDQFNRAVRPEVMSGSWHSEYLNRVPKLADAATRPAQENEEPEARGARRRAAVEPGLKSKRWTQARWATMAGVDSSVVYDYLKGESKPTPESRKALAEALGVKEPDLPQ